jgi:GntR family transcriptional regulator, transcriptional repressor for pyruvate dehydrogenase complex
MNTEIGKNIFNESPKQGGIFGKLDVAPAYRVVFETIERLIMSGRLKPGDVLPTETELAEQFSINRSTLREGIRLLEQNGLVVRGAAKRLTIAVPHIVDLASRMSRALILHDVTFQELWETYMILEPAMAELAANRISDEAVEELEENLVQLENSRNDLDRFHALDSHFHSVIAEAAGNRPMKLAREPISILMMPAARAILPRLNTYDRVIHAHRQILDALRDHDETRASQWMRKHTADFKRGYERIGFGANERLVNLGSEADKRS